MMSIQRTLKPVLLAAVLIVLGCSGLTPAAASIGEAGQAAAFMKMGVGTRALGLGGAFVGLADDGSASFWNVAGLTNVSHKEFTTMHAVLNLDRKFNYLGYVQPLPKQFVFGLGWMRFGVDMIEERAGANDPRGYAAGDLIGYFDDTEDCVYGSVAWETTNGFSLGMNLKYLRQQLYTARAWSLGMDLGVWYKPNHYFSVGASVRDVGTKLKWNTASGRQDNVPITTTVGCAFHPRSNISLALDIRKIEDLRASVHFGVEGWINEFVAARGGLDDGDLCLGSSFRWDRWQFDYGFQDNDMGDIHRLSGTLRFDFP